MISRGNWRRPPPGPPEINRDLARGITEAHIIGSVPYNALTGVRDDIWDSTNAVSNGGVGRRTTTANTAVKLLSPNNTAAGDFTVIWYGKPEAFGSGYTALWDKGNGGTRENTLFFDTSNAISYVGVGGTHGGWAPGVSVSLNRQNVVILRRSGSTVSACINGKLGSTTFSSSGTSTSSDGFFWMGQNISGGGSSSGAIHNYLLVFNRCITDAEAEQASTDAWFYFRKSPRNLIFIPSAGGGGATGTGAPAAQSATVAGTATRTVTGSGTPTAQAATAAGTAEREITSSGTLAAQSATVSGTGTVGAVVTGSGSPQAQSATVAGTAERTVTASGTVAAQSATVAGTAEREITSSGTPTAQSAAVVGAGQVGNIISGSGTPTAQSATVSGTAEREITASGTISASAATVVGTAERTITATGTLAASSATVYGFDSAPVSGNPTSGGGTGKVYSSKKLRREVDEWLEKQQESERQKFLARLQREDEELMVIMLALAA